MSVITMKQLLEAGSHFGHKTSTWNPKMSKYIYIKRNNIHILDLKQTVDCVNEAYAFVKDEISKGGSILFVGAKKQIQSTVEEGAKECGAFYVNKRWYGGTLTNLNTIKKSIAKLDYYEKLVEDDTINNFPKIERTKMKRKYDKIMNALGGIREMKEAPSIIFVLDVINSAIAILEAKKLSIPIVAIVDTNVDPDSIDFPIPANDDAIRSVKLIVDTIAKAVNEGKQILTEGMDSGMLREEKEDEAEAENVSLEEKDKIISEEKLEKNEEK